MPCSSPPSSAQGALALGLGALVLSGHAELWHVYVFALLLGVVSAFDGPVRQIFVAELVPADKLPNAVGLNSASFNAARLIGPGLAGLLIAWVGTGWVFVINGVSYAATILALVAMRTSELRALPRADGGRRGQLREGLRYVRGRSDIMVIMIVMGVVSTFGLNFQLTSAMMARTVFGKGAGEYGILGSILAIGSLSGALLAARRERPRVRLVIGAALAFGAAMSVQALMPTYLTYAVMCIPVGLASLTMMTAANSAIQVSTEPQMRGRVMALYMMVFIGATPIGSPLIGWVAQAFGARWAVGIGGIATRAGRRGRRGLGQPGLARRGALPTALAPAPGGASRRARPGASSPGSAPRSRWRSSGPGTTPRRPDPRRTGPRLAVAG